MNARTEFFERLQDKMATAESIAVTCHRNPDGDALGSSLPIVQILKGMGKSVDHLIPDSISKGLQFLPYIDQCIEGQLPSNHTYDLVITTDTAAQSLSVLKELSLQELATDTYWFIDHHEINTLPTNHAYIEHHASSACEIVAQWLIERKLDQINNDVATLLYTGMVTDTGNFRRGNTSSSEASKTLNTAARLLELGADRERVELGLYRSLNTDEVKCIGLFLTRVTTVGSVIYSFLKKSELEEHNTDMRSIVTGTSIMYGLENQGGVYCIMTWDDLDETQQSIKGSLRTTSEINVAQLATHFDGGGHAKAAGFKVFRNGSFEDTTERLIERMNTIISTQQSAK